MFVYDMMLLWDYSAYNAGFLIINPTAFSFYVYQNVKRITNESSKLDDQKALNIVLKDCKSKDKVGFSRLVYVLDVNKLADSILILLHFKIYIFYRIFALPLFYFMQIQVSVW